MPEISNSVLSGGNSLFSRRQILPIYPTLSGLDVFKKLDLMTN